MDKKKPGSLINSQDADMRRRPTNKQTKQRPMIFHTPAGTHNVNRRFVKPRRTASPQPPSTGNKKTSTAKTPASTARTPQFETPQSMMMTATPQSGISYVQPSAKRAASSAKASSSSRKRAPPSSSSSSSSVRRTKMTARKSIPGSGSSSSSTSSSRRGRGRAAAAASSSSSSSASRRTRGRKTGGAASTTSSTPSSSSATRTRAGGRKQPAPASASRKVTARKGVATKKTQKAATARTAAAKRQQARTTTKGGAARSGKGAASKRKTKIRRDPDYNPENVLRLYSLDASALRSVTTATDIDLAIATVDRCIADIEDSTLSPVVRGALAEIADEFRYHALDMVELLQEVKAVQRSLRRANAKSNKLRQMLLESQSESAQLAVDVEHMRTKHEHTTRLRKVAEDAHEYLTKCERVHAHALRNKDAKPRALHHRHNAASRLLSLRALLSSAPAITDAAQGIDAFLDTL
ncbi:hypothetical protein PTSG_06794 [Salpingoeca rosetta]|uniref:Uncharacterized protein n=1 Tax=Salpingoeca rosetta (strain ATCC 50818 / BSB-021) TaxID=946362 RepID=F2UET9_SALR5|nr:uncharacterized protein PTSG_06794 [Salpingoeca rosetta]EGD75139.1 hypothetical protein PTSG_06794 [Salpingoeca rosetta]|eukprot:XP_004992192.1 hypothetical protein PTSG_06794 [Salpingoeca rosetta]